MGSSDVKDLQSDLDVGGTKKPTSNPIKHLAAQAFKVSLSQGLLHCLAYFFSPDSPVMQHVSPRSRG